MKRTIQLLALLCLAALAGCSGSDSLVIDATPITGSGVVVVENRQVSGFVAVSMIAIGTLRIAEGAQTSLTIQGEDNIVQNINTTVTNGILQIWSSGTVELFPTQPVDIQLTASGLVSVAFSGAGTLEADGLTGDADHRLQVVSGVPGPFTLTNLNVEQIDVFVEGAGDIEASGLTTQLNVLISSTGSFDGTNLPSTDSIVLSEGAGNATVRVSTMLDVILSGSGSVWYIGTPTVVADITGSGEVGPLP